MRKQTENQFLEDPINTLIDIKAQFEGHPAVCTTISNADLIQFAGMFSVVRQSVTNPSTGLPGLTLAKVNSLKTFEWGRLDEINCDKMWTDNLPGFKSGKSGRALRCLEAGKEIKNKMMDRNGFTAREATALIGAHTIGLIRNTFGPLAGPWVPNGVDDATDEGPVFDNAFHDFLENGIVANNVEEFVNNMAPFESDFGGNNWFRDDPPVPSSGLDYLDTDVTLAFDSQDTNEHPNFHVFTTEFANSNLAFLQAFFPALRKMGKLGVTVPLQTVGPCDACAPVVITPAQLITALRKVGSTLAQADETQRQRQALRADEIANLTTPVNVTVGNSDPMPTTLSPTTAAPTLAPTSLSPTTADPTPVPGGVSLTPPPVLAVNASVPPEPSSLPSSAPSVMNLGNIEDAQQFFGGNETDSTPISFLTIADGEE